MQDEDNFFLVSQKQILYILPKYFIGIYITYYLYAASSTAAVISLQFIKFIHKNYYTCLYIREINSETRTSLSHSTIFLLNVREPLKQRKLDFIKAKHIFVRIQFMVIDFGKSRFSESKSDNLEQNVRYSLPIVL